MNSSQQPLKYRRASVVQSTMPTRTALEMYTESENNLKKNAPILTAPVGSRFLYGHNARLSVTLISARNLYPSDHSGNSEVFVVVRQANYKYKSRPITSTGEPVFNETFAFDVFNPNGEIMVIEIFEKERLGRKSLLGYVPIELTLLPINMGVTTTERLSFTPYGELTISLHATDFGLENTDRDYLARYTSWRKILPPVSHNARARNGEAKDSQGNVVIPTQKDGSALYSPANERRLESKVPGPYGGKFTPKGYDIVNGYVKRSPSHINKAFSKTKITLKGFMKGMKGKR